MKAWKIGWACGVLAGYAFASAQTGAIKRLYIEPFVTKMGAEKLRDDVIAELRKLRSVSLAPSETGADAILGGGGEIWIKGYRSLNPRSGRWPSNGTPVYAGYLSVELRDPKVETIWSYLATPGGASGDVSKDLSKGIVNIWSRPWTSLWHSLRKRPCRNPRRCWPRRAPRFRILSTPNGLRITDARIRQ